CAGSSEDRRRGRHRSSPRPRRGRGTERSRTAGRAPEPIAYRDTHGDSVSDSLAESVTQPDAHGPGHGWTDAAASAHDERRGNAAPDLLLPGPRGVPHLPAHAADRLRRTRWRERRRLVPRRERGGTADLLR